MINKAIAGQSEYQSTNISSARDGFTNYGTSGFKNFHDFSEVTEEELAILFRAMAICAKYDSFEEGVEADIEAQLASIYEAKKVVEPVKVVEK